MKKLLLTLVAFIILVPSSLSAFTTAALSSSSASGWTNSSNVFTSNNSRASQTINVADGITTPLLVSGFGFTLPANAIIKGFTAVVERRHSGSALTQIDDASVKLLKAGSPVGSDFQQDANWPNGSDNNATYGSVSNLWGSSWTPADVNDSSFGLFLTAECSTCGLVPRDPEVDHVTISVAYTLPQTLTFVGAPLASKTYGDTSFGVSVSNTASNPVAITSTTPAVCTTSAVPPASAVVTIVGVGTCTLSASAAGTTDYEAAGPVTESFTVTAKALSVSGITANNKPYDALTTATLAGAPVFTGLVGGDIVTPLTASFGNKTVGNAKPVTLTMTGPQAANYTLTDPGLTANITPATLTVTPVVSNKLYDDLLTGTLASCGYAGLIGGDVVNPCTGSALFSDQHVGAAKPVAVTSLALGGADAGNYTYNTSGAATADITVRPLTVTAVAATKVYDGTTTSTGVPVVAGIQGGDTFVVSQVYDTAAVGAGTKTLTPSITITDDNSGANYSVTLVPVATGTITPLALTLSGTAVTPKVYDKTTPATLTFGSAALVGVVAGDVGNVFPDATGYVANFASSNAGTHSVTVSGITLIGAASSNYTLTQPSPTGTITPRPITVTAQTNTKVYDSLFTAAALPLITVGTLQGTDSAVWSEVYADKNVGTGKTLTPSGVITDDNGGANYTVTFINNTTGVITAKDMTVTATGVNKVYDGTSAATVTLASADIIGGDIVNLAYTGATFVDKHVGAGKAVSVTGITKSGAEAGNYNLLNTTAATTADITPKFLTVTPTVVTRVYDTLTVATINCADDRLLGDVLAVSCTGAYSDKTVGVGKQFFYTASKLGPDAANYDFAPLPLAFGTITKAPVTISFTTDNKVYDATTAATIATRTVNSGVLGLDAVTVTGGTATFANKNVGTSKVVTALANTFVLGGVDGGNYDVTVVNPSSADITAKTLTITFVADNKVYDGTTAATGTYGDDRVVGDIFDPITGTAVFSDKNVGSWQVDATGITLTGTDAANYVANTSATDPSADITPLNLTATLTADDKVYDAGTGATTTCAVTPISPDVVTCTVGSATFADKIVGTGKTVSGTGLALGGTDAGNYTLLPNTATDTADITPASLIVTFTTANKSYDGTTAATITSSALSGILGGPDDVTVSGGTASFDTKHVGITKPVDASVASFSLGGADAGNYEIATVTTSYADIEAIPLTITFTAANKPYDGTSAATITSVTPAGIIAPDVVTLTGVANFSDPAVGNGKTVTAVFTIGGANGGNYYVGSVGTATANIEPTGNGGLVGGNSGGGGSVGGSGIAPTSQGIAAGGSTTNPSQTFVFNPQQGNSSALTFGPGNANGGTGLAGTPNGSVAGVTTFKFLKNMSFSSRLSPDVTELQKILIAKGFLKTRATGVYGQATRVAVTAYQKANGIAQTGAVGPKTRDALNAGK